MASEKRWYIVQTYSGKENSVMENLVSRISMLDMQEQIFQVLVPEETVIEETVDKKTGEKVKKEKVQKIYPGYVFVEMIDNDASWWVVRNTPGVTGFLGSSGNKTRPVPVLDEEMEPILEACGVKRESEINFEVGDNVTITGGNYKDFTGVVTEIDLSNKKCTVEVEMFGGQTVPITDLDLVNVEKID